MIPTTRTRYRQGIAPIRVAVVIVAVIVIVVVVVAVVFVVVFVARSTALNGPATRQRHCDESLFSHYPLSLPRTLLTVQNSLI